MDLSSSWQYITDVARSRLAHNKTSHHVYEYGEGIEVLGVAGEIVARRFLGLSEKLHCGFDGGVDLSYATMKIDVKATVLTPNIRHRFLQWPEGKRVRADVILLTAIDPITKIGTVMGYATRNDVQTAPINRSRFQPCYEIPVTSLRPAWELDEEFIRMKALNVQSQA